MGEPRKADRSLGPMGGRGEHRTRTSEQVSLLIRRLGVRSGACSSSSLKGPVLTPSLDIRRLKYITTSSPTISRAILHLHNKLH